MGLHRLILVLIALIVMLVILPGSVLEQVPILGKIGLKISEKFSQLLQFGEDLFRRGISIVVNAYKTAVNAIQRVWSAINTTIDKINTLLDKAIRINKIIQE